MRPASCVRTPQRLGLAVNCIKFAEAAMDPTDSCTGTYGLLTSTLHVLDSVDTPSSLVPILFRARVAFEHGLWPQLRSCGEMRRANRLMPGAQTHNDNGGGRFLVEQGHIVCHNCRHTRPRIEFARQRRGRLRCWLWCATALPRRGSTSICPRMHAGSAPQWWTISCAIIWDWPGSVELSVVSDFFLRT